MNTITIHGKIPSKSNCYKVVTIGGHSSLAKTRAIKDYEQSFFLQCPMRGTNLDKYFKLSVDVYYENMRPDLDNCFKVLLDCLQQCKAIKNDRYCVEIHGRKLIDKENPRIEFTIEEEI
jgi:Holliday junction resolvase RusA-like endonuclease